MFFLNAPLALVVLSVVHWRIPDSPASPPVGKLDWPGALLVTLGLGSLVYGLLEAPQLGFRHPFVFGALALSAGVLAGFLLVERSSPAPMLPLGLFRSRTFRGVNLLTLLLYAALGGQPVLSAVLPDSGPRLFRHPGRGGVSADERHHVCRLALGGRSGGSLRRPPAAADRTVCGGRRLCHPGPAGP